MSLAGALAMHAPTPNGTRLEASSPTASPQPPSPEYLDSYQSNFWHLPDHAACAGSHDAGSSGEVGNGTAPAGTYTMYNAVYGQSRAQSMSSIDSAMTNSAWGGNTPRQSDGPHVPLSSPPLVRGDREHLPTILSPGRAAASSSSPQQDDALWAGVGEELCGPGQLQAAYSLASLDGVLYAPPHGVTPPLAAPPAGAAMEEFEASATPAVTRDPSVAPHARLNLHVSIPDSQVEAAGAHAGGGSGCVPAQAGSALCTPESRASHTSAATSATTNTSSMLVSPALMFPSAVGAGGGGLGLCARGGRLGCAVCVCVCAPRLCRFSSFGCCDRSC